MVNADVIRIHTKTKKRLEALELHPKETPSEIIDRLLDLGEKESKRIKNNFIKLVASGKIKSVDILGLVNDNKKLKEHAK